METRIDRYGASNDLAGLPARSFVLTNSQRGTAVCSLRWFYGHGLGLVRDATPPMRMGTAWGGVMQDVWSWWAVPDRGPYPDPDFTSGVCRWCGGLNPGLGCFACGSTGLDPIARARRGFLQYQARLEHPEKTAEEVEHDAETLRRAARGYLIRYGTTGPDTMRVLAVEVPIVRQVLRPDGGEYRPEVPVVADGDGWRFALPTDRASDTTRVRWPWFVAGKLDVLAVDRGTGRGLHVEHKYGSQVSRYVHMLTHDTQTPTYQWLIEGAVQRARTSPIDAPGWAREIARTTQPGEEMAGYYLDFTSSGFHYDARQLASKPTKANPDPAPVLSTAASPTVPSWLYEEAVERLGLWSDGRVDGEKRAEYRDHIAKLRRDVDRKLYYREWTAVGRSDVRRLEIELYHSARDLAAARRRIVEFDDLDPAELALRYPRTMVCNLPGGGCAFRGPCTQDGPDVRARYAVRPTQSWTTDTDTQPDEVVDDLGF